MKCSRYPVRKKKKRVQNLKHGKRDGKLMNTSKCVKTSYETTIYFSVNKSLKEMYIFMYTGCFEIRPTNSEGCKHQEDEKFL